MKRKRMLAILAILMALTGMAGCGGTAGQPGLGGSHADTRDPNQAGEVTWDEITAEGVNEALLLEHVDPELLTEIARELQTLMEEATQEEREHPEIVITQGWARVFEYERDQKVLHMGSPAMKPLYLILYKSPHAGEYEYLCANILYELSGFDFDWTNSREFLEKFNQEIIESKS